MGWKGVISNNGTVVYSDINSSPSGSVGRYLQMNQAYPALMIYDYGGKGMDRNQTSDW